MNISDEGLRLIKSFEGFHTKLPDGRAKAYQAKYKDKSGKEHLDIPTCGWGCTEGVTPDTIWTVDEAEAALRREIEKHEKAIVQMVTVDINQNQFDSMCSLSFNVGAGAVKKSTVLKRLNRGEYTEAAKAFELFNGAYGGVQPGLVSRRKREAAHFLKPAEPTDGPAMPQRVTEAREPLSRKIVATVTSAGGAGAAYVSTNGIPPVPPKLTETVSNVGAWKGLGAGADPLTLFGLAVVLCAVAWFAVDKWRSE